MAWQKRYRPGMRKYNLERRNKARKAIRDFFGGKCARCGFNDYRALDVDHINGNANKEGRVAVETLWPWVEAHPQEARLKYQLLCANCNRIKMHERKEWPGVPRKEVLHVAA